MKNNIIYLFLLLFTITACVRTPAQETSTQSPVITQHITIIENSTITGAEVAGLNLEKTDAAPAQTTITHEERGRNNWIFYTIAFVILFIAGWLFVKQQTKGLNK